MLLRKMTLALAHATVGGRPLKPGQHDGVDSMLASAGSLSAADENALIRQSQAGSRAAFEELVRRFDADVLRLAYNLTRNNEDARDLYQEAFLKVYKNLHLFRFECSFYTWVYRIVTNVCLDHLRRRKSRPEDQAPDTYESSSDSATMTDFFDRQPEQASATFPSAIVTANPERRLLGKEIGRQIEFALQQLSARERMVFELKHYHGLRLRAIGQVLGTSEETVKNSLFRATRKLRARLEGAGLGPQRPS